MTMQFISVGCFLLALSALPLALPKNDSMIDRSLDKLALEGRGVTENFTEMPTALLFTDNAAFVFKLSSAQPTPKRLTT